MLSFQATVYNHVGLVCVEDRMFFSVVIIIIIISIRQAGNVFIMLVCLHVNKITQKAI